MPVTQEASPTASEFDVLANPDAREAHQAQLDYNNQHAWLAQQLQRDIRIRVPHGRLVGVDEAIALREPAFTVLWHAAPNIHVHDAITMPTAGYGYTGDGEAIMLDAVNPGIPLDQDPLGLAYRYGQQVGSEFLGPLMLEEILNTFVRNWDEVSDGAVVGDGEHRITHGWLFEDFAFIPYDLVHTRNAQAVVQAVMEHIYGQGEAATGASREEIRNRMAEAAERQQRERAERMAQTVRDFAGSLNSDAVRQAEQHVEERNVAAEAHRSRYMAALRELEDAMIHLDGLRRAGPNAVDESKIGIVKDMLDNGIITDFQPRHGSSFRFTTRNILMMDDRTGAYHNLGTVRVTVDMSNASVTFNNMTRRVDAYNPGMHHPHVFSRGNSCLGNFSEMIVPVCQNYDWFSAIQMILAFLETANTEDVAGQHVHNWPYVKDPTKYGYPAYPDPERPPEPRGGFPDEDEEPDEEAE